jgi:hypothetical protein
MVGFMHNSLLIHQSVTRSGTILIMVAGISALLASLALTFLVRMREDVISSHQIMREVQARIMLAAACNYIMETSRMGWDHPLFEDGLPSNYNGTVPGNPINADDQLHREGFGWVDVRDGQIGPKDEKGYLMSEPRIGQINPATGRPRGAGIGSSLKVIEWIDLMLSEDQRPAVRCPMYVMKRPPFAVKPIVSPNPVLTTGANEFKPYTNLWLGGADDPWRHLDPQPVVSLNRDIKDFRREYAIGDKAPDSRYSNDAWFRVWRAGPALFVVTCGAGKTQGFKTWDEVKKEQAQPQFFNDPAYFQTLLGDENYLFYLVEWSPYVSANDYQRVADDYDIPGKRQLESYVQYPVNTSQKGRNQSKFFNPVGTIRSIQRLTNVPDYW